MSKVLGNKLPINSIDIMPSTINHNNEYLVVNDAETAYEYVTSDEIKNKINVSYDKNGTVNKGYNRVQDISVTNMSTTCVRGMCSNGYVVTTNGAQLDSSWNVANSYMGANLGQWYSAKADNIWLCVQTPVPMAYTSMLKRVIDWYDNIRLYEPPHFIVEASNNGVDFDIISDITEANLIPNNVYVYNFNENKVKYRFWRLRYPTAGVNGQRFSFCFNGEIETNLYTQTDFQKNKLVKLKTLWLQDTIPYRTNYTDANNLGTVSGSANITEYNASNRMWQAFRGRVDTSNQGWLSVNGQALPCDLIYTPTTIYEPGFYSFMFRNGIWGDTWGYSALNVAIIAVGEDNSECTVWHRIMHMVNPRQYSTEILHIPFSFKQVKWRIISKYSGHVSMGWCQVCKYTEQPAGNRYSERTIFEANKGNNLLSGGYLHTREISYNVDENNPLEVTFPNNEKKVFTSLEPIEIKPQKKFRLITPKHLETTTYNRDLFGELSGNEEYKDIVDGTCSGSGSQLDASRYFWRAICTDVRTYNDCWLTTANGALGGPIYIWNQTKPKGRYVFKFNTGWWADTNGYSASEVRVQVRNGDADTWKTVWNVINIPATYATYWWSPVVDIDFEFNQVYFQMVGRNQAYHGGISCCAVFQECDENYVICTGWNSQTVPNASQYEPILERAYQYAYDYQESQNLYLKNDGTTYGLSNLIYRQPNEPSEPKENDVWFNNKNEVLRIYQYKDNKWIDFNDVYLGNINLINGLIQSFHENPYNDNGTTKNSDCVWSSELTLSDEATSFDGDVFIIPNLISSVYHNLNIQDTTKYKAECYLKCISEDLGYQMGEIAQGAVIPLNETLYAEPIPYLTKNTIGIWNSNLSNGWRIIHRYSGAMVGITDTAKWKLVFKIREL